MASPEHLSHGQEMSEHLNNLELAPELKDRKVEKSVEEAPEETERKVEQAREEANKEAVSGREVSQGEYKAAPKETTHLPHSREASYKHTMKRVQNELTAPERIFSKVIHNKAVERTSELVGNTVARPDAILSGSVFACVAVLGLYLLAKYNGFSLQGSETILAFILGWAFGLVFDFVRTMITGKR